MPNDAFIARIDALASRAVHVGSQPGVSMAVSRQGRTLLRRGYGYADLKGLVPARPETVYRVGSVTKQFTAAAIMDLAQEGRLGLHDEVVRFLPEFPTRGHRLTVRHLLTHTSGIENYTDLPTFWELTAEPVPREEVVRLFAGRFTFPPGQDWAYSNSNYLLLGLLIERLSGRSYARYLADRIFAPLGMRDTGYCLDEPAGPQQAKGYEVADENNVVDAHPLCMEHPFASGGLCSTVDDLVKWSEAFHGRRFLTEPSYQLMVNPTRLENGTIVPYGFGLRIETLHGSRVISHRGEINGFSSWLAYLADRSMTVVVLANSASRPAEDLIAGVLNACDGESPER